jgi:hypothetical protein
MPKYVRSDAKKIIQKGQDFAVIKIQEIVLTNNPSKFLRNKISCKIIYQEKEFVSNPEISYSDYTFEIKLETSTILHVCVYSKGFLFGVNKIGSCDIDINDLPEKLTKKLILYKNEPVGNIYLSVDIVTENCIFSTQPTCNSLDMREDTLKNSSHLCLDVLKHKKEPFTSKDANLDTSADEINELNMIKFIQKVSASKKKILNQQHELSLLNKNLEKRSEKLAIEKYKIAIEAENIKEERNKLQKMILKLNSDFYQLKHEKFRNRAHKKLIQNTKLRISQNLNRLNKQKNLCDLGPISNSSEKENMDYSILGLSESVMPVRCLESPVPEEQMLEDF